jgi:tetratricopeptide (TPR) repeat protein
MSMHQKFMNAGLVLALGILPAFASAACVDPPALKSKLQAHPDADTYAELGNWYGEHHQYDCATEAFHSALKLEPGSAQLSYLVGLSLYTAGNAEESVAPLQQSIQLMPEVLKPHLILGAALDQLGRNPEGKKEWEDALKIDAHSTVALDGLSKNRLAAGDYPSVITLLRPLPRTEDLTLDLALAYGQGKMLPEAAKTLTEALRKSPSSLRLSGALATNLVNQALYQEAVRVAREGTRLHPRNLEAQKLLLRVLVLNSDTAEARPLARKLLIASPHDFYFLYMNGILESEAGQFTAARAHLQEAVTLDPNHYNARYNLGIVLAELKDLTGAKAQLQKAIELGGTETQIRFKYASVLRSLGEMDAAEEQLKLYQQQTKANSDHALAVNKTAQADKEMSSGDPQKAVALYREALAVAPDDPPLTFKLAVALDRTGDTAAETTLLEHAIRIDPSFALAQNQLGYLASRSGDAAAAEEHFREAVRAAPGYIQAWVSLAATLAMQSRFPEAQEALASALRIDPTNAEALQLRKDLTAAQAQR